MGNRIEILTRKEEEEEEEEEACRQQAPTPDVYTYIPNYKASHPRRS
jgi:hypothetical protein